MDMHDVEEAKLWEQWLKTNSADACNELMRLYMPLVHYHVQRIAIGLPRTVPQDDLVSHGLIGLYDAITKFKPERNLKFDTYASFRVKGAIIDGLRKEDWLPRTTRDKVKKIEATIERLQQQLGRTVSSEEVAKELQLDVEEIERALSEHYFSNLLSIDEHNEDNEREETYASTIVDEQTKTPEQHTIDLAMKEELASLIEQLSENEQLVISLYYYEEMTLTEIGQILQLSTSRISQIHSKALFRLKQAMRKKG